jgi:hypothetical protein
MCKSHVCVPLQKSQLNNKTMPQEKMMIPYIIHLKLSQKQSLPNYHPFLGLLLLLFNFEGHDFHI